MVTTRALVFQADNNDSAAALRYREVATLPQASALLPLIRNLACVVNQSSGATRWLLVSPSWLHDKPRTRIWLSSCALQQVRTKLDFQDNISVASRC